MLFRNISFISLILFILSGCSGSGSDQSANSAYKNVDNQELQQLLDQGVPIVDIRRPDEWRQTGTIKNSLKMTFVDGSGRLKPDFLPMFTEKFGPDDTVILICRTGNRTRALANHLAGKMGYTHIVNVKNGITSWIREGRPVVR